MNLFVECDCQGGWIRNEGILCHFDRLDDNIMMMATKPGGSFFVIADFSNSIGSGLVIHRGGNITSRRYHHEEKTRRFSSSGEDHDLARNEYWMLSGVETSFCRGCGGLRVGTHHETNLKEREFPAGVSLLRALSCFSVVCMT